MSTLVKKLHAWVNAGLISQAQAEQIAKFETKDDNKRSWLLYGIVAVGVSAIGIGIISLIAANWGHIPPTVKLLSYLLAHSAAGVGVLKLLPRSGTMREGAIGIFALIFFAGIGLTAQIYHLQSDGWGGILFWNLLSLPVILLATTRPVQYLWVIMLMTAESIWFFSHMERYDDVKHATLYSGIVIASLYVYLCAGLIAKRWRPFPPHLAEALRMLSLLAIFVGGTIVGNIIWYEGADDMLTHRDAVALSRLHLVPWAGALLVGLTTQLIRPVWSRAMAASYTAMYFGIALFISLPIVLQTGEHPVIGTVLTIVLWSIAAVTAVNAGRKRLFDAITLAITIRLLVVYFEVFGSMVETGFGLILSGLIVLAFAGGWYFFRGRMAGVVRSRQ